MSTKKAQNRSSKQRIRQTAGSLPVRIGVTLALLGVVASQIDWSKLERRLRHGHPLDFIAAVILVLVALIVGACRWWRLLGRAELRLDPPRLARVYAVSTFSGTFLPTSVGGDVTRALLVTRRPTLLPRVGITIVVDRLGGLVGLLGMAWLAFALGSATVPLGAQIFLTWVTIGVLVGSLLLAALLFRRSGVVRSFVPNRLILIARESRSLLRTYAADPRTMTVLLLTSLLYQALISLQLVMLARAIDVHLAFATAAVTLALVTVVTLIPVSIGGFGVREGSYVVLLGGASIGATDATAISVLSVAALFLASLPGAFMLMRGGLVPALEAVPQ
jgi:glycosyltransferase 2 family protein